MINKTHGLDRGFPKGGYVINGNTVTVTKYAVWNGRGFSTATRLKTAQKIAKLESFFNLISGRSKQGSDDVNS